MSWELLFRGTEITFAILGASATIYAAKLWLQAQKYRAITEAKDEALKVSAINAQAWKSHYDAAHLELTKYREEQHTRNDENNSRMLVLTDENAHLRSKTDLTPVLKLIQDFFEKQTAINAKILAALLNLEKRITGNRQKLSRLTGKRTKKAIKI